MSNTDQLTFNIELSLADLARFRQGAYRLCSQWFLYPDHYTVGVAAEVAHYLKQYEDISTNLSCFCEWNNFLTTLANTKIEELERLQDSYMALFGGSGDLRAISLCESAYLTTNTIAGSLLAKISEQYQRQGVMANSAEVPDHIAVELEFISFLCGQEQEFWEDEKPDLLTKTLRKQQKFLQQHLYLWFTNVLQNVISRDNGIYSDLCRATWSLIVHDAEFLKLFIEDLENKES